MAAAPHFEARLLRNVGWQGVTVLLRALVSLAALAVLARLSGPATMGVFGIAWVGPAITLALLQSGPGQALFLIPDMKPAHVSAAFLSTIALALSACLAIAGLGPLTAAAFDIADLVRAHLIAAAFVPLMGLGVVDMALIQRDLNFRMVALVQTGSACLAAGLAVGIAYFWDALIGLCALQGALGLFQFILFRLAARPRPALTTGWREVREVWSHGRHLVANSITASAPTNYPQLLLGAFLPVEQLGLFTLSRRIIELINNQTGGMVGQVLFPTIASNRGDLAAVASTYLKSSRLTATMIMIPLIVIIAVPGAVLVLFAGDAWRPGATVLLMLAVMQVGLSLSQNVAWVMQAIGRASTVWRWNLAFIAWQAILLMVFGQGSATAVAGTMAVSTLAMPIPAYILSRHLGFEMRVWAKNMASALLLGVILGIVVHFAAAHMLPPDAPMLIVAGTGALAAFTYAAAMLRLEPTIWHALKPRLRWPS